MNLAAITLIRNEADIFPAFAQHLAALFDTALFLDHNSADGTTAMIEAACAARAGWQRWHVTVPGLHQSLFTTFALRHLFATTQADAAVLLDADEFIDVPDRAALHDAIAAPRPVRCVPCLAWRNAVPLRITGAPLRFGDALLTAPTPSPFTKVIVTRTLFNATGGALKPHAGNHVIDPGDGIPLTTEMVGTMLHLPLRSVEQMARKTLLAALAHLARTDRQPHEGSHRFDALARLAEDGLTEDDMRGWAAAYGDQGAHNTPKSEAALRAQGFAPRPLDVAHADGPAIPGVPAQTPEAALAAALREWHPNDSAGLTLALENGVLTGKSTVSGAPSTYAGVGAMLRERTQERDAARAEITALRASTSWRLTAPLRALFHKAIQ